MRRQVLPGIATSVIAFKHCTRSISCAFTVHPDLTTTFTHSDHHTLFLLIQCNMVKRHAEGALVACTSSCLDVLPCQLQHRAVDQPLVLGSIENLPTSTKSDAARFVANKKQCRLGVDQGPQPVDASSLLAQARAVLRQPSCAVNEAPIGREQEYEQLTEVFDTFSSSGCGSSIYVSGLPGTGG